MIGISLPTMILISVNDHYTQSQLSISLNIAFSSFSSFIAASLIAFASYHVITVHHTIITLAKAHPV